MELLKQGYDIIAIDFLVESYFGPIELSNERLQIVSGLLRQILRKGMGRLEDSDLYNNPFSKLLTR